MKISISNLIRRKDTCILLDAGEGTCSQIVRFYGNDADIVFRKIKGIYVSHLHADHHIGTFQLAYSIRYPIFSFFSFFLQVCLESFK